jgi:hypothetical protein
LKVPQWMSSFSSFFKRRVNFSSFSLAGFFID